MSLLIYYLLFIRLGLIINYNYAAQSPAPQPDLIRKSFSNSNSDRFKITKPVINAQFEIRDVDVEIFDTKFQKQIAIECKLAKNNKFEIKVFNNTSNPYYDLISNNNQNLNFYNNLLDTNLVIPNVEEHKNLDFAISTNIKILPNHPFALGMVNEEKTFLNSSGSGFFENKPNTKTIYLDYEKKYEFDNFNFSTDLSLGQTYLRFNYIAWTCCK